MDKAEVAKLTAQELEEGREILAGGTRFALCLTKGDLENANLKNFDDNMKAKLKSKGGVWSLEYIFQQTQKGADVSKMVKGMCFPYALIITRLRPSWNKAEIPTEHHYITPQQKTIFMQNTSWKTACLDAAEDKQNKKKRKNNNSNNKNNHHRPAPPKPVEPEYEP